MPSPNHNERRPNFIIIHDTSNDNIEQPLRTLTDPVREVSAHYLIGYDVADISAALLAFRRHYLGITTEGEATDEERRLMHCLIQEKRVKQSENGAQRVSFMTWSVEPICRDQAGVT